MKKKIKPASFDCVVVGAGLSGLAAAEVLSSMKPKYRVLLIEKENYLGGRASTLNASGFLVECGAVYIVYLSEFVRTFLNTCGYVTSDLCKVSKRIVVIKSGKKHVLDFSNIELALKSIRDFELMPAKTKLSPLTYYYFLRCVLRFRRIKEDYVNFSFFNKFSARFELEKYFTKDLIDDVFEPLSRTFLFSNLADVSEAMFSILIGAFIDPTNNICYPRAGFGHMCKQIHSVSKKQGLVTVRGKVKNIVAVGTKFRIDIGVKRKILTNAVIAAMPISQVEAIAHQSKFVRGLKINYVPMICASVLLPRPIKQIGANHLVLVPDENSDLSMIGEFTHKVSNVAPMGRGLLYLTLKPERVRNYFEKNNYQIRLGLSAGLSAALGNDFEINLNKDDVFVFKWQNAFVLTDKSYFDYNEVTTDLKGFFICGDHIFPGVDGVIRSGVNAAMAADRYLRIKKG